MCSLPCFSPSIAPKLAVLSLLTMSIELAVAVRPVAGDCNAQFGNIRKRFRTLRPPSASYKIASIWFLSCHVSVALGLDGCPCTDPDNGTDFGLVHHVHLKTSSEESVSSFAIIHDSSRGVLPLLGHPLKLFLHKKRENQ